MATQSALQHSVASTNLADLLERVLDKGIVIAGDIKIKLVDIELLTLQIRLVVCSVDKAKELGLDWWANNAAFNPGNGQKQVEDAVARIEERVARLESRSLADRPLEGRELP